MFMQFSWTLNTLGHDLLIAKLGACRFETDALRCIKRYFRKQRVRVNKTFNEWKRKTTGLPQGSILGPLLFNIFLPLSFSMFPFDAPEKHQKTYDFLTFSGGSKGNIGKKRVKRYLHNSEKKLIFNSIIKS